MGTVTCTDLNNYQENRPIVVDVMTPEDYACCHIPQAINACIYEVVFLDKIKEAVADPASKIVVYDASGTTRAAEMARQRLTEAGYRDVSILKGGLAAWRAAGLPVEMNDQGGLFEPQLQNGMYVIDAGKSVLEWIGRNLNNRHVGRIAIRSGNLVVRGGLPSEGSIVLDMKSISNIDLQDDGWREMLLNHLKSDDFFGVERFPTAEFKLTSWTPQPGSPVEAPVGMLGGNLSIRDVTKPITFPAKISPQADGSLKAHALFDIDRTLWNVNYGSGKLFERLGMHLVDDRITVELFVVAARSNH